QVKEIMHRITQTGHRLTSSIQQYPHSEGGQLGGLGLSKVSTDHTHTHTHTYTHTTTRHPHTHTHTKWLKTPFVIPMLDVRVCLVHCTRESTCNASPCDF